MTYDELKRILDRKKLSVMDFCNETGIKPQVITNAKKRGGEFSASTMKKMSSFLQSNEAELFAGSNPIQVTDFIIDIEGVEHYIESANENDLKRIQTLASYFLAKKEGEKK